MFTWLFWLMIIFAVIDWTASWRGWHEVRWISKPGTLILLIAWFTQIGGWTGGLVWFGLGLFFSLLGDIFLNLPVKFFLPGIGAFLLAHVFYIAGFLQKPVTLDWKLILPLLLVGSAFFILNRRIQAGLRQHGETQLKIPVTVYATTLSLMLLSALSTLLRADWNIQPALWASLGAALFFLSDSLLAYNRFVRRLPIADLLVMVTYHLGQILIAFGALGHVIRS